MEPAPAHGSSAALVITADPERQADVRAFVRSRAAAAGASDEATADLVQAVDELVCNVIEHGYGQRTADPIEVVIETVRDTVVVRIRDHAPAFDPRTAPVPRLDLPLAQRPLGGMGVYLARTLTDGMDHRILPGGGNEVTLTKALRPTDAAGG